MSDIGLPEGSSLYDISATYNHDTMPRRLSIDSELPAEVWARVAVEAGAVEIVYEGPGKSVHAAPKQAAIIPPRTPFRLKAVGKPLRFFLEYYHEPRLADGAALAAELGGTRGGMASA